ncbi:histidine kinase, partial [Lachnotalea glycerini]
MDRIEELCRQYTDLSDDEIMNIRMMSNMVQALANLEDADGFIDLPCRNGDAIGAGEGKPSGVPGSDQGSVGGMLAKKENEPAVARTLSLGISTKHMKALTQESNHVIQSVEPIIRGERTIGVLISERRVDEQYLASRRLHLSKNSFEKMADVLTNIENNNAWLTECIEEGLLLINKERTVIFRNSVAKDLYKNLGYVEDVLGQIYDNICLVVPEYQNERSKDSSVETTIGKHTLCIRHVKLDREELELAVVIRDMTWIREQEKELILKSVVVKEMHHRVKNNLQTVASLLRIQSRHCDNELTRLVLGETMERILAISATHQLLAQNGVDQVNIKEVLQTICNNTLRYNASPGFDIDLTIEGDDFEVDSDVSTSVALIVNELLQNSLKYAFTKKSSGKVKVIVTYGVLYSEISIVDDGIGFNVNSIRRESLGLN